MIDTSTYPLTTEIDCDCGLNNHYTIPDIFCPYILARCTCGKRYLLSVVYDKDNNYYYPAVLEVSKDFENTLKEQGAIYLTDKLD